MVGDTFQVPTVPSESSTWYWTYLFPSVTQLFEEMSAPDVMESQEEKAVAPDMSELFEVRILTVVVGVSEVVQDDVAQVAPPSENLVLKMLDVRVPSLLVAVKAPELVVIFVEAENPVAVLVLTELLDQSVCVHEEEPIFKEPLLMIAEDEPVLKFVSLSNASLTVEVPTRFRRTAPAPVVVACTMVVAPSPVTLLLLKSASALHVFVVVAASVYGRREGTI